MTTATTPARVHGLLGNRPTTNLIADYLALDEIPTSHETARAKLWIMQEIDRRGDDGLLALALDVCPTCWGHICDCMEA